MRGLLWFSQVIGHAAQQISRISFGSEHSWPESEKFVTNMEQIDQSLQNAIPISAIKTMPNR